MECASRRVHLSLNGVDCIGLLTNWHELRTDLGDTVYTVLYAARKLFRLLRDSASDISSKTSMQIDRRRLLGTRRTHSQDPQYQVFGDQYSETVNSPQSSARNPHCDKDVEPRAFCVMRDE